MCLYLSLMEKYDVIIAGASFAGLSVASQLRGKILLVDRHDIGSFQISACGAPLDVIKKIGCEDAILQISNIFSFHVNGKRIDFYLEKPYCTFDFSKFCSILNLKNHSDFLKAKVIGAKKEGNLFSLYTTKGKFSSDILVDATGWQASITETISPGYISRDMLSFGIETEVPYRCDSFHFYYEPDFLKDGIGWGFPCGDFSRIGIASYTGARKLIGKLDFFLERFDLKRRKLHGGFFCYCIKEPVVNDIFVVGCAQGQTLPLTGEGIRGCITYGRRCGEILQRVMDGRINVEQGRKEYQRLALEHERAYSVLLRLQNRLLRTSEKKIEIAARVISIKWISRRIERWYLNI